MKPRIKRIECDYSTIFDVKLSLINLLFLGYVASVPLASFNADIFWIRWVLAFLFFIAYLFSNSTKFYLTPLYFIFALWIIISTFWLLIYGINMSSGLIHFFSVLFQFILIITIVSYIKQKGLTYLNLALVVFFAASLLTTLPLIKLIIFEGILDTSLRYSKGFYNPNHVSYLYGVSGTISIYLFFVYRSFLSRIAILIGYILFFLGIIATASIQGFLVFCIGSALSMFFFFGSLKTLILLLLFIIPFFTVFGDIEEREYLIGRRLERAVVSITNLEHAESGSISTRMNLIKSGYEMFKQNFFSGVGFNQYRHYAVDYGAVRGTYAHNNYIEVLISGGLFGFLCYYGFIFIILYKSSKLRNISYLHRLVPILVVLIFVGDVARVSYYQNIEMTILALALASQARN